MMPRVLAACGPGEVRVGVVRDDELLDYAIWRPGASDGVGDLHRARVIAKVPAMAGSFLALDGTEGFLPDSDCGAGLREGDFVSVRITRAAQGGKGPRLTARLAVDEVPPARGPGGLLELARRYPDAPVLIDDSALAVRVKPVLGDRVDVVTKAFDGELEAQVQALEQPDVDLRNGIRLHIHPTPALVAIDVDAGGAVAPRQGKAAAHLAANLAVLPVLARQIRLRNLSGAILVDFAGLPARRRASLAPALHAALAEDPLHPRLLGFTALGLAEIVRPRVHPPLHELLAGPHAAGLVALRRIAAEVASPPHRMPALRASPAIVAALRDDAEALPDLARRAGRALILRSDPNLPATAWRIEASDG
ncbi:MAG TPA: ribonuclease E/G [Acetobacteraceae bacterium]|nr:ribonuclease E/G [Acetobacteraceae bacterium]